MRPKEGAKGTIPLAGDSQGDRALLSREAFFSESVHQFSTTFTFRVMPLTSRTSTQVPAG